MASKLASQDEPYVSMIEEFINKIKGCKYVKKYQDQWDELEKRFSNGEYRLQSDQDFMKKIREVYQWARETMEEDPSNQILFVHEVDKILEPIWLKIEKYKDDIFKLSAKLLRYLGHSLQRFRGVCGYSLSGVYMKVEVKMLKDHGNLQKVSIHIEEVMENHPSDFKGKEVKDLVKFVVIGKLPRLELDWMPWLEIRQCSSNGYVTQTPGAFFKVKKKVKRMEKEEGLQKEKDKEEDKADRQEKFVVTTCTHGKNLEKFQFKIQMDQKNKFCGRYYRGVYNKPEQCVNIPDENETTEQNLEVEPCQTTAMQKVQQQFHEDNNDLPINAVFKKTDIKNRMHKRFPSIDMTIKHEAAGGEDEQGAVGGEPRNEVEGGEKSDGVGGGQIFKVISSGPHIDLCMIEVLECKKDAIKVLTSNIPPTTEDYVRIQSLFRVNESHKNIKVQKIGAKTGLTKGTLVNVGTFSFRLKKENIWINDVLLIEQDHTFAESEEATENESHSSTIQDIQTSADPDVPMNPSEDMSPRNPFALQGDSGALITQRPSGCGTKDVEAIGIHLYHYNTANNPYKQNLNYAIACHIKDAVSCLEKEMDLELEFMPTIVRASQKSHVE